MAISDGFALLESVLKDTTVFNISWVISMIFVFLTLLIITRDTNKWKSLAFPVTILWHIIGITPSFLFYVITGIVFVIDALSLETIGSLLQATITGTKEITNNPNKTNLRKLAQKTRDKKRTKELQKLSTEDLLKVLKKGKMK